MTAADTGLSGIVSRRAFDLASELLADEPVIALQGPRTVGKSTLLAELAETYGVGVIDLDDPVVRAAVAADPGDYVGGPAPVCIDEYQHVPEILDAIKASLNRRLEPGRYVLAGSTRYDSLPPLAQSLAGRLHLMDLWPLTQCEIEGTPRPCLLEGLLSDPETYAPRGIVSDSTREHYVARIVAGGMPVALARRTVAARNRWLDDYPRLVIERDVRELSALRGRERLPRLFERLAAQTANVLNIAAAASQAGLDRGTATDYLKLLEAVFLLVRLPAWGTSLLSRVGKAPKVHVVDSGVAARLLRLTPEKLTRRDPASLSQFGHLLETFVVGELVRQASWIDGVSSCGHWRTHDGDEVDLVIERDDGVVLAFEVKAGRRVTSTDARHLRKLREALGERFLLGVVLHTGAHAYRVEDRLHAMPVDRLWAPV
ncbi:MAG: ATP-binding protein [Solirubrobacteraceae bacterium]